MTPDTTDDMATRSTERKTFRPPVDDYFRRHVRDDHAPNAALHSTLRALAESDASRVANVNLMASHGPGEKDHSPTHEVVVDIENGGAGTASTGGTIVSKLVDYDDVVITDAESSSIVPESDAYDGDGDYPVDRLTVRLRPVEARVEPVEVPYRFIPDDAKGISEATVAAAMRHLRTRLNGEVKGVHPLTVLSDVLDDYGLPIADADEDAPGVEDVETIAECTLSKEDVSTFDYDSNKSVYHADVDDADDAVRAARAILTTFDVDHPVEPTGYAHGGDTRSGVPYDDGEGDDEGDCTARDTDVARDDLGGLDRNAEFVTIPCGCGDYSVSAERGKTPPKIDVVCPECGNHFGHGDKSDRFADVDHLRRDAARTLRTAIDDVGVNDRTRIAAKCLATLLCTNAPNSDYDDVEPDAAPTVEYEDLLDRADVDFAEGTRRRLFDDDLYHSIDYGDGKTLEVPDFESSHDAVDAAKAIVREFAQDYHAGDLAQIFVREKDGWDTGVTDVFESFDMRRYTIDVFNRAYGRHRDDSEDVTPGTPAEGIASGLGLAATAEAIDRRDDGDGVDRGDVDLPDEVIGKALYKGTLAFNDDGRLFDNRDAMREAADGGSE